MMILLLVFAALVAIMAACVNVNLVACEEDKLKRERGNREW